MKKIDNFAHERVENISEINKDDNINKLGLNFLRESTVFNYSYNFDSIYIFSLILLGLVLIYFDQIDL